MKQTIDLGLKQIGDLCPVFIIAEAGVNHNGDLAMAKKLVEEAGACGADCVKFQTFKAERVVTKNAPKARYQLGTTDRVESQLEMLKKIELKPQDHLQLKAMAEKLGLIFLSTPYNFEDIDFLETIGVPAYKVASGQIVEQAFLRRIAKNKKPIFLSTGMATLDEIGDAVMTIKKEGNDKVILLQCTTNYPSRIEDANLRAMQAMRTRFGALTGYSDHTTGECAALAAVALGAVVIEKHFTLDKGLPGPDHSSSMTPAELKPLIKKIRQIGLSLGKAEKEPAAVESENAVGMRRSIAASCDIRKGEKITYAKVTFKRPATGLAPKFFDGIIGKRAAKDIASDEILQKDMIEW